MSPEALAAILEAKPGAVAERGPVAGVTLHKVMGKMFAVLSPRKTPYVVLKCDPHLAEVMREHYAGVGHKTHLDPRHWIAVELDADVPDSEIARLAAHSYELVCAGLTRKQKAELAALS